MGFCTEVCVCSCVCVHGDACEHVCVQPTPQPAPEPASEPCSAPPPGEDTPFGVVSLLEILGSKLDKEAVRASLLQGWGMPG